MTPFETSLCLYMQRAVVAGIVGVDPSQTSISNKKLADANWINWPHYEIVPGAVRPYGAGNGAQNGGSLLTTQRLTIYVFTKMKISMHGFATGQIVDPQYGVSQIGEELFDVFRHTYFGSADGTNCLLNEPLWYSSNGDTIWEDVDTGLVSREFSWDAVHGVALGNISVILPQVANATL